MILHHIRWQQTKNSTRGYLIAQFSKIADALKFVCELLEDGPRLIKVRGLTRIDAQIYHVVPIQYGKFYDKYKADGDLFAIALMDAKGVDTAGRHGNVRAHKGNTVEDTDGCPLTAVRVDYDPKTKNFIVVAGSSTPAYRRLYETLLEVYDQETNTFTEDVFWKISEQFV